MTADAIAAEKAALRKVMRARRAALTPEMRAAASLAVRDGLPAWLSTEKFARTDEVIAGYWPIRDELDPRPAMQAFARRGHRLALPTSIAKGEPLVFRAWSPGDPLALDIMGIQAPLSSAPEVVPWLVLVPMLAFDSSCRRLGYGAGFYDRTLAMLRARSETLAVGLAFGAQEVERVPVAAGDEPLDQVVTETQVIIG
ncbi:MAG TPA: 5-formyltetrahydrofolate cyclo-ligase [Stellaceae bacterium]|nr:5-formyltetrahydrofolate cyclo-ligase [Stellaceae bacterium]